MRVRGKGGENLMHTAHLSDVCMDMSIDEPSNTNLDGPPRRLPQSGPEVRVCRRVVGPGFEVAREAGQEGVACGLM